MAYNNNGGAFDRNANTNFWATMMSDAAKSAANTWMGLKQNETQNRQIQNNYDVANNQIDLERRKHQFELDKNKHQNMVNENLALSNTNAMVSLANAAAKGKYWKSRINTLKTNMNDPYAVKYYEEYEDTNQRDLDLAEQARLAKEKQDYNNTINGYSKSIAAAANSGYDITKNTQYQELLGKFNDLSKKYNSLSNPSAASGSSTAQVRTVSPPVQNNIGWWDYLTDPDGDWATTTNFSESYKNFASNDSSRLESIGNTMAGIGYGLIGIPAIGTDLFTAIMRASAIGGRKAGYWLSQPSEGGK